MTNTLPRVTHEVSTKHFGFNGEERLMTLQRLADTNFRLLIASTFPGRTPAVIELFLSPVGLGMLSGLLTYGNEAILHHPLPEGSDVQA